MGSHEFLQSRARLLLPVSIGVLVFLAIPSSRILNPTHIGWLTLGDPAQHFLGWQFFRDTPLLQSPMGANPSFGLDIGSSIVYTDSLPLLAILFKPFRAVLPPTFQYMGAWILLCFILQAALGWKLIENFSSNVWVKVVGAGFFAVAPPFLYRMHAHEALMGHWLILAALWLYFSDRWSPGRWLALLVVASLVHAYLMLMVAAIWVADRATRLFTRKVKRMQVAFSGLISLAVLGLVMWQAGYFMLSTRSLEVGVYGYYRMNLISPIHADGGWSVLMSGTPLNPGEIEGQNFLGVGGLILAILAAGELLRDSSAARGFRRIWPLTAMAAMLALYAFSNRVAFGSTELFTIPLSKPVVDAASIFRASGRFFWPVYYLIYLGAMYVLATRYPPRAAAGILAALLVLQVADCSQMLKLLHSRLHDWQPWVSSLQSPFWTAAAGQYKKILYVPPHEAPRNYFDLSYYAARNHMPINIGAFARTDQEAQARMTAQLARAVSAGAFEPDALYVFEQGRLWNAALAAIRSGDRAGAIDGFRVLAPKWSECVPCAAAEAFAPDGTIQRLLTYQLGTPIGFDLLGNSRDYVMEGFSDPEPWGTWTDGNSAKLAFRTIGDLKSDLTLTLANYAYVMPKHPVQEAEVVVNGRSVGRLDYVRPGAVETRQVGIPKDAAASRGGDITIELRLPRAVSPSEIGEPADARRLGLGLVSATLSQAKN